MIRHLRLTRFITAFSIMLFTFVAWTNVPSTSNSFAAVQNSSSQYLLSSTTSSISSYLSEVKTRVFEGLDALTTQENWHSTKQSTYAPPIGRNCVVVSNVPRQLWLLNRSLLI